MSKSRAKTASKNNPVGRASAVKFLLDGKDEVRPVEILMDNRRFFGAEYVGSGALVFDEAKNPISWKNAVLRSLRK